MSGIRAEATAQSPFPWARALDLAVAGVISLALMLDPYVLRGVSAPRVHEGLPLLLLGVSGAFVHGFGFRPANRIMRWLTHPAATWPLLALGAAIMLRP